VIDFMGGKQLILEAWKRLCEIDPEAPAVIDAETGATTSRAELGTRSDTITARLSHAGVGQGDLVAIQLPNSVDFLAAVLAVRSRQAIVVPIDRDSSQKEVATVLKHFGARALIYHGASNRLEVTPMSDARRLEPAEGIALIKLTSGSSGLPKGIMTSEANLFADCHNICASMGIESGDLNLGAIPFSHSYGFSNLVTPLLLRGTAVVATNQYLPLALLAISNRFRCTVFPGIPMIFDHLGRLPREDGTFETVRTFLSAGAPLRDFVSRALRERFGSAIHSFYGCSECGGISYDRLGASVERGSVGHAMEGVTLELEPETGRLVIVSDAVAMGYVFGSEEENWRFAPGRYTTDDLARINDDGEVELTGRVGDMINIAGKKVNPREVEQIILQMPAVREAKVYGESAGARGDVVAAAVVGDPGLTREDVRRFCRQHLSSWKVPRVVKILDQLPLDERGKIKKSLLAEL
jgi:acyl-CoA synthetase (AMP-forming)/AMP-acid ligase II